VVELDGVSPDHRVACHWVERIVAGELEAHDVDPEMVVEHDVSRDDSPFIPDAL
jgi:peptide/nickel transport system ATP-binding protein